MVEAPVHPAVEFLRDVFGVSTAANVYVCSLANADALDREPGERRVMCREPDMIQGFSVKNDRKDRGLFFCVSTIEIGANRRAKETVAEINGLHTDIDLKGITISGDEVLAVLRQCPHLPSKVVSSGNGFHAYWLFKESLPATEENRERIEHILGLLCDHFAGDPTVAHIAALMRLPGTHNTKNGEWKEVKVIENRPIRYAWLDELEEWLETSRPVIFRKAKTNGSNGHAEHLNPFEAVAAQFAGKAPIDVEKTLAEMAVGNIHASQLSVTAALLNRGHDLEEVLQIVLDATKAAAGDYAKRWNWRREEKTIRGMCQDWLKKHPEIAEPIAKGQDVVKHTTWPDWDKKNKRPAVTFANAIVALQNLNVVCRNDVFHDQFVISSELIDRWGPQLSDGVITILRALIKARFGFDPSEKNTRDAAIFACLQNQFDPVVDYLASLKWDGVPRIDRWTSVYLGAADTEINREFGRLFLIAAVRRARSPGCKFDQILILEGEQGAGKSTALKILAGEDNFSDQHILAASDREQQEASRGVWIHEIAELSGMARADVERVKSFASRTEDRARPAYGRIRVDMKRRGVYTASTNKETYLKDETGNRRFWPLRIGKIDLEAIARDRDQLWAEAAMIEAKGGTSIKLAESFWPEATKQQEARAEEEIWHEAIALYLATRHETSVAEVLTGCIEIRKGDIKRSDEMRVSKILKQSGFVRAQKSVGGQLVWIYRKPTVPPASLTHQPPADGVRIAEVGELAKEHRSPTSPTSPTFSDDDEVRF